ncbi:hypothetical protein CXB51_031312 [Gossypium anomalum]|uniref:Aminotransferase-like plant mobile domain-containing protein n=1 Tax=Gossypium anomalum TaxID=47600 RepID=A0A8J5Y6P6_9ROSI|nr:hypothetical protein CXB51_031312 [Gossypium anomalum]
MPNLRSFSSHQNKYTGETPLTFCTFTLYARGLGWFNKLDRVAHLIRKVLTRDRLPKNGFLMEELIIQTTEKNTVVQDWSLKTQKEKGDSLMEGCVSNLPEHVTVNVRQNNLEGLVRIWNQWDLDTRGIFAERYEDVANLIATNVDERLIQAMIKKKNETSCIPWFSLRDLVLNHPDMLKRVNLFALAIYGLIVFPKVLGHIEVALLNVWILSHFWKVERTPFHMFSKTFAPLEAYLEKEWPKEVTKQYWVSVFQNLRAEDVTWRAPWIRPSSEFAFTGEGYMKRVRDTAKSWKKIHLMELALYADTLTQDYYIWRKQRVNSQQISSTNNTVRNPFSKEMPSELEMARQEFEREKAKMSRDFSALQEENYQLKIDVQIERSRTEKVQKEAEVIRYDLRDLHLENKKLRGTIKNSGLGKSSAEWKEELNNIRGGMEFWKGKVKKEEEKAARAMIELRKKNAKYEAVSAELDTLLEALEEKNSQYDKDIRAY